VRRIGVGAGAAIVLAALVYAYAAWKDEPPASPANIAADEDPPTLAGAVRKAAEHAGNDVEATSSRSLVLAGWANRHLQWKDVDVKSDETSVELVKRNVDGQLGKRMCVAGKVTSLNLSRTDSARFASGVLVAASGAPFAYMAARATGSNVQEGQQARLCGVVTGQNPIASDLGPPGAVVLVGMFEADRGEQVAP